VCGPYRRASRDSRWAKRNRREGSVSASLSVPECPACPSLQADLDPLQQLLRAEQKKERKLKEQQQQESEKAAAGGAGEGPQLSTSAALLPEVAAAENPAAASSSGQKRSHGEDDEYQERPGPARKGYLAEDERRWRKAANIIDSVLSQ
jgi:hypothetical protein